MTSVFLAFMVALMIWLAMLIANLMVDSFFPEYTRTKCEWEYRKALREYKRITGMDFKASDFKTKPTPKPVELKVRKLPVRL